MNTDRNRVVGISLPQPTIGLTAVPDGGRILFNANTIEFDFGVEYVADEAGPFQYTQPLELGYRNVDGSGEAPIYFANNPGEFRQEREAGTRWSHEYRVEDDSTRIISQYEDGVWDGLRPGEVVGYARVPGRPETEFVSDNTTRFDVSGEDVKENARYGNLAFGHTPGGKTVQPSFTFSNPANHGISPDVRVTATVGGSVVSERRLTTAISGATDSTPERTTVTPPAFRLPDQAVIEGSTVNYTIEPLVSWLDAATGTYTPPPATEWITAPCDPNPERVAVGDTFSVGVTFKSDNGAEVDVPVEYEAVAGGSRSAGEVVVPSGANEQVDANTTFVAQETGPVETFVQWDPNY